jgi:hypothetical protein
LKNPITQKLRKLLDEEGEKKITLIRSHDHNSEPVDEESKTTMKGNILSTETYPSQDLINKIHTKTLKIRNKNCQKSEYKIKYR